MSKKTKEITLQDSLLRHFGKNYSDLVLAINTAWMEDTTVFIDTILRVIPYAEINKENNKNTAENVITFAVRVQQAL